MKETSQGNALPSFPPCPFYLRLLNPVPRLTGRDLKLILGEEYISPNVMNHFPGSTSSSPRSSYGLWDLLHMERPWSGLSEALE